MTTLTDWRKICAELIKDVRYLIDCVDSDDCDPVALMECREHLSQTRTALSQPEPEVAGLSDQELLDLADDCDLERFEGERSYPDGNVFKEGCWEAWDHQLIAFARVIQQRCATPQPSPVPVAERLPGPEDCAPWPGEPDATHWAWAGKCVDGGWEWSQLSMLGLGSNTLGRIIAGGGWTHWARWDALPMPGTEVG